jgi:hypothetical protein
MPLKPLEDNNQVTTWRGVEFWMADEAGSLVLCSITHEALRELLEQVASDVFDAGEAEKQVVSSSLRKRSTEGDTVGGYNLRAGALKFSQSDCSFCRGAPLRMGPYSASVSGSMLALVSCRV